MALNIPSKLEEIYPLTIATMRYSDRWVIFCSLSNADCVSDAQENEAAQHDFPEWMANMHPDVEYGIGETINLAFTDFQHRSIR